MRTVSVCGRMSAFIIRLKGRDHLIVRIRIQLGLRPEELFALRRNDVPTSLAK
jgi:integrase